MQAAAVAKALFARMGVDDRTAISGEKGAPGTFEFERNWYQFYGAGHIAGTTRMGSDAKTSVFDSFCRSHDHDNLFICGTSTMVTVGTTNPTNTGVAIALRACESIVKAASG